MKVGLHLLDQLTIMSSNSSAWFFLFRRNKNQIKAAMSARPTTPPTTPPTMAPVSELNEVGQSLDTPRLTGSEREAREGTQGGGHSLLPPELPDPLLLPSVTAVVSTDPSLSVLVTVLYHTEIQHRRSLRSAYQTSLRMGKPGATDKVLPPVT